MFCVCAFVFSQSDADDDFSPLDAYFLGRAVASDILSVYKLYNNPEANQYLNRICQALAINSPYQAPYKGFFVFLLDSNEFNAFATPGGHIFNTKRMAASASSEDMLKVLQSESAKGSALGGFYSTHPSPEQRIANVEVLKFKKNDTLRYRAQRFKSVKF